MHTRSASLALLHNLSLRPSFSPASLDHAVRTFIYYMTPCSLTYRSAELLLVASLYAFQETVDPHPNLVLVTPAFCGEHRDLRHGVADELGGQLRIAVAVAPHGRVEC
jgi:hypothetical protein